MDRLRGAGHSSPISQATTAALDPQPVVYSRQIQRLLLPKAADCSCELPIAIVWPASGVGDVLRCEDQSQLRRLS